MKKLSGLFIVVSIFASAVLFSFAMPAFAASSAKFAAHVRQPGDGLFLLHNGMANTSWPEPDGTNPAKAYSEAKILHTTIKTANKKDLLIGVSLQSGIFTDTTAKGKNGSREQAGAMAAIEVEVKIDGHPVYPSNVIFAKRVQELTAVLGGVIQTCTPVCSTELVYDADGNVIDAVTTCEDIVVALHCIVTDEEIGLALTTTSANHFNFVAPNLDSGEHTVEVYAKALSSAEFTNGHVQIPIFDADGNIIGYEDGEETTDNIARSSALVKLGSLTVEEVRATNNPDGVVIDLDTGVTDPGPNNCDPDVEFCQ